MAHIEGEIVVKRPAEEVFGRWGTAAAAGTGGTRWTEKTPASFDCGSAAEVRDTWLDGPGCTETKGVWTVKAVDPPRTLALHSMLDAAITDDVPHYAARG